MFVPMRPDQDLRDPRLSPRLPARCAVVIRHRFSRWRAESEDLGPDGCQLVTPRLVPAGRHVRLTIQIPELGQAVERTATVVWSRAAEPSRLGLRFTDGRGDRRWFESLLAADPALASTARRRTGALPWRTPLFLGAPPRLIVDFTRDELAVLRRLRPGMAVVELVATFGRMPERLIGALFALVARRRIVLDAAASPGPGAWGEVLAERKGAGAPEALTPEHRLPPPRATPPDRVQRLLAEGREHLEAGRIALAAERFREARALAPDDKDTRAELRRLGPFA